MTAAGGALGTSALGAVGGVVVARALGPGDRGVVALAVLAATVIGSLGTGGIQFWLIRTTARTGFDEGIAAVLRRHLIGVMAAGIVVAIGLALTPAPMVWWSVLVVSLAWTAASLLLAVPNGRRQVTAVSLAQVGGSVAYVATVTILWLRGVESVAAIVLATGTTQVAVAAVGALVTGRWPRPTTGSDARRIHRRVVAETWPAALSEVLTVAAARLDVVVVAAVLASADVGVYAVALSVAELPVLAANAAVQITLPWVGADPGRSVAVMHRRLMGGSLLAGCGLAAVAPAAVPFIFGEAYADAAGLVPVLVVGAVLLGSWKLLVTDLSARGDNRSRATSALLGVAVMVGADLILVPALGLVGAAIGSGCGYAASLVVVVSAWRRSGGGTVGDLYALRRSDFARSARVPVDGPPEDDH